MPYFFKLEDIISFKDAYEEFEFAIADFIIGCKNELDDPNVKILIFNLRPYDVIQHKEYEYKVEQHISNEYFINFYRYKYW